MQKAMISKLLIIFGLSALCQFNIIQQPEHELIKLIINALLKNAI